MLRDSLTAKEIDWETEILQSWKNYGVAKAARLCDSLGVVLDSSLERGLQSIYSVAFLAGLAEEVSYITQDSLKTDRDPLGMARGSFEADREELISFIKGIELKRKAPAAEEDSDSSAVNN